MTDIVFLSYAAHRECHSFPTRRSSDLTTSIHPPSTRVYASHRPHRPPPSLPPRRGFYPTKSIHTPSTRVHAPHPPTPPAPPLVSLHCFLPTHMLQTPNSRGLRPPNLRYPPLDHHPNLLPCTSVTRVIKNKMKTILPIQPSLLTL